jgi:acetyltransferase-like isoleucine patch superfamily enzyme
MIGLLKTLIIGILERRTVRAIRELCTLHGEHQSFTRRSHVSLKDGSKKSDIVLDDHVWMFGELNSQSGGRIHMQRYSKIGEGSTINAVLSVVVGAYTAIGENVMIMDNNTHPVNPEDRRWMRTLPIDSPYRLWRYADAKPIVIGENAWIGGGSRINKGVTIGDNAVVPAPW